MRAVVRHEEDQPIRYSQVNRIGAVASRINVRHHAHRRSIRLPQLGSTAATVAWKKERAVQVDKATEVI